MNHNSNNPNTAGITIGLPNSSNKGFDIKAGIIESNPNTPYIPNNNLKLYDSKYNAKRVAIACIVDCPFDMTSKEQQNENDMLNFGKQATESTSPNNANKPFNYKDSNITAKEIINKDNTSTLVIETKTNLLKYQGNTADTLMSGVSGIFASMAELAKQYGLDEAVKKAGGAKGRVLASVLFQTQGASVSLAYNYGNNGRDMLKAGVSVGIEIFAGSVATALIPASAPVLVFVGIAVTASVGINLFLNTQIGKNTIDLVVDKLQSFFALFDSNPNRYELISNPNLESKDYQSLIELLLDTNSTAKDIDSLLHSFPHYLQDSKQPLESTNTDSTPTQSSTESNSTQSTTPTTKSPQQTKESNTPKNNNPNTKNTNTFPFQLAIKDYNTFTPLQNKTIQLTNIDSKQIYTQTTIKSK